MIIAGTGHRPAVCPCKYNEGHTWLLGVKNKVRAALQRDKPDAVISGMALGFDIWLAEVALNLDIPVHAYVPFPQQGDNWPKSSRDRHKEILDQAEKIHITQPYYTKYAFLQRDREMVDACDHLYALFNDEFTSGGTFYTVKYAQEKGRPMTNFWV